MFLHESEDVPPDQQLQLAWCNDVLPGMIRIRRADDHLKVCIHFPEVFDGFQAVPPGRHPHINERHRIRATFIPRQLHHNEGGLPLIGTVQVEPFERF